MGWGDFLITNFYQQASNATQHYEPRTPRSSQNTLIGEALFEGKQNLRTVMWFKGPEDDYFSLKKVPKGHSYSKYYHDYEEVTLGFLAKISFTPLLYHPGGCLGCPEKRASSRNYIFLFGLLCCFFAKMEWHSKKLQKLSKSSEIFRVCSILAGKQQP